MKNCFVSLLFIAAFSLGACGGSDEFGSGNGDTGGAEGGVTSKHEEYSYELSMNGCNTGRHTFPDQGQLCEGLKNSNLNHGCASYLRELQFRSQKCAGEFIEN